MRQRRNDVIILVEDEDVYLMVGDGEGPARTASWTGWERRDDDSRGTDHGKDQLTFVVLKLVYQKPHGSVIQAT